LPDPFGIVLLVEIDEIDPLLREIRATVPQHVQDGTRWTVLLEQLPRTEAAELEELLNEWT
jgi:hypothetical protein